jgi:hypothetical protein
MVAANSTDDRMAVFRMVMMDINYGFERAAFPIFRDLPVVVLSVKLATGRSARHPPAKAT